MSEPLLLWCKSCHVGYASIGEIPSVCPSCGKSPAAWTTARPYDAPLTPFHNSETDRVWLQSQKISGDD